MNFNKSPDWKTVLIISILILYLLFFSSLYKEEVKTFVEGWSRELIITEINDQKASELMAVKSVKVIPLEEKNKFIVIWYADEKIIYTQVNENGKIISQSQLDLKVSGSNKLEGYIRNDFIHLYNLNKGNLFYYSFELDTAKILSNKKVAENVNDITVVAESLIYANDSSLSMVKDEKDTVIVKGKPIIGVHGENHLGSNIYNLAFVEETKGERTLKLGLLDINNSSFKEHSIAVLPSQNTISVSQIDIASSRNDIHIMVSSTNIKAKKAPIVEYYRLSLQNPDKVESFPITIFSYAPNPKIISVNGDHITFIASEDIKKGSNTEATALVQYTIAKDEVISKELLTNTDDLSLNPQFFKLKDYKYLVWSQQTGNNKSILFASDHPEIVRKASNLQGEEWIKLIADTILGLVPILFIALLPFMYMYMPVCILMFIFSLFRLTWMENNAKLVLRAGIILHILIKIYYSLTSFSADSPMAESLPQFLSNPLSISIAIFLTTSVAIYCTLSLLDKKGSSHFFMTYTFFAVIDTLLFSLLFLPYYYADLILSYFTKVG